MLLWLWDAAKGGRLNRSARLRALEKAQQEEEDIKYVHSYNNFHAQLCSVFSYSSVLIFYASFCLLLSSFTMPIVLIHCCHAQICSVFMLNSAICDHAHV